MIVTRGYGRYQLILTRGFGSSRLWGEVLKLASKIRRTLWLKSSLL